SFHVLHKVPSGDGPYVRAKHEQLIEKDPEAAIAWFWEAIYSGDRVDSALKDMAVVMKQLDRTQEAIEAIHSFRAMCSRNSQESLDNVLIDLYKKSGRIDEQIELLKHKLKQIYQGEAFNGKPTKTARSHGKKFQVNITQETSKTLGNLAWAYMQKSNFVAAEVVYRKANMIDPDANKALNLCHCLLKQGRYEEAGSALDDVLHYKIPGSDEAKSRNRAAELAVELLNSKRKNRAPSLLRSDRSSEDGFIEALDQWAAPRSRRLPIFEEI
ncbi:hypothetical protein M569_13275, partial [Genlisea aurea]